MPAGTGRTAAAVALASQSPGRTLLLVADWERVRPTRATVKKFWPGVEVGDLECGRRWAECPIVVASVYSRPPEPLDENPEPDFDLLIFDDCHRVPATARDVFTRRFGRAFVLGVAATPGQLTDDLYWCFGAHALHTYTRMSQA
jgi:superfamily II DNA or RNA helicase